MITSKRRAAARKRLYELQRGRCCYCERTMKRPGGAHPLCATIEHLKRQIDGGTSRWDNLALACQECNSGRGITDWLTYKSYRMGELAA